MKLRLFLMYPIPHTVIDALVKTQQTIREQQPHLDVTWVKPEAMHITVLFFGDIEESRVSDLIETIATETNAFHSFEYCLTHVDFFGNTHFPRIIFASCKEQDSDVGTALYSNLVNACTDGGFIEEARSWKPHITLGRNKSSARVDNFVVPELPDVCFPVHEIILTKSTLTPSGPVYDRVTSFDLKTR